MATPGSFTSGQVLTAAEMNALPAGALATNESSSDFLLSTLYTDIMDITFTLASTRKVMIAASIPLVDLVSATTTNCGNRFQDTNAAGSPANYYGEFFAMTTTHGLGQATFYNVTTLIAGTYTVYWVAKTNSGTARYNGETSTDRRHQLTAIDLGAG